MQLKNFAISHPCTGQCIKVTFKKNSRVKRGQERDCGEEADKHGMGKAASFVAAARGALFLSLLHTPSNASFVITSMKLLPAKNRQRSKKKILVHA